MIAKASESSRESWNNLFHIIELPDFDRRDKLRRRPNNFNTLIYYFKGADIDWSVIMQSQQVDFSTRIGPYRIWILMEIKTFFSSILFMKNKKRE